MPMNPSPDSSASLDDWFDWLVTLSPREMELGLERISRVLARLALPRPSRVIHIAGTNGKGSCAAMLDALYRADGRRVGCYTSPHVLRFNERIRIDGNDIDDERQLQALRKVEGVRGKTALTFFEYTTAAALVAFAEAGIDVAILEIGLGGRLDAVNAVDPDAALITNIGLDHCDWLGTDLNGIAREKAGIMRPGIPVVYASRSMPAAIAEVAAQQSAVLLRTGYEFSHRITATGWDWEKGTHTLQGLQPPPLRGAFQYENASGVLAAYACLESIDGLTPEFVNKAWSGVTLAGRMQLLQERWFLDVAHNPLAAEELARELACQFPQGGVTAVIGALRDKDVAGMLTPLIPVVDRWVSTTPQNPRAMPAWELAAIVAALTDKPCYVAATVADALLTAERIAGPDHHLLVTGSFFVVGPALEELQRAAE